MKPRSFKHQIFFLIVPTICSLQLTLVNTHAQYYPYYDPFVYTSLFYPSFSYSFPFALPYNSQLLAYFGRSAHTPLSNPSNTPVSLFRAPILPSVPAVSAGGVGVTTLIPTVPISISVPVNSLTVNPLAGLIAYTPLSLVGLTYAPIPIPVPSTPVL